MKPSFLLPGLVLLTSLFFTLTPPKTFGAAPLPPAAPMAARITRASGEVLTVRSRERFRALALLPGENVTIQVQLPPRVVNIPAVVQALDGGLVTSNLALAADGTASVGFRAGLQPGRYRLLLMALGRSAILQFEVANR